MRNALGVYGFLALFRYIHFLQHDIIEEILYRSVGGFLVPGHDVLSHIWWNYRWKIDFPAKFTHPQHSITCMLPWVALVKFPVQLKRNASVHRPTSSAHKS